MTTLEALAAEIRDRVGTGEFDDPNNALDDLGDDGYEALAELILTPGLVSALVPNMSATRVRNELEALYGPDGDSFYLFDEDGLEAATKLIVAMGIERDPADAQTSTVAEAAERLGDFIPTHDDEYVAAAVRREFPGLDDVQVAEAVRGIGTGEYTFAGLEKLFAQIDLVTTPAPAATTAAPAAETTETRVRTAFPTMTDVQVAEAVRGIKAGEYSVDTLRGLFAYLGSDQQRRDMAAAVAPAGDAGGGDAPAGDAPAGDAGGGDAPAGDAPAEPVWMVAGDQPELVISQLMDRFAEADSPISRETAEVILAQIVEDRMEDIREAVTWWLERGGEAPAGERTVISRVDNGDGTETVTYSDGTVETLTIGLPTREELEGLLASAVVSEYANEFGYYGSFLSHPQVGPILMLAAHEEWSLEKLESVLSAPDVDFKKTLERLQELEGYGYDLDEFGLGQELMNFLLAYEGTGEDQSWWRTTAPTKRAWDMLLVSDPASAGVQLEAQMDLLRTEAGNLRMTISEERLETLATDSIVQGWDGTEISRNLLAESHWDPGAAETGAIGANMTSIRGLINKYMLTYDDPIVEDWARKIYLGEESLDVLTEDFREAAKMNFPSLADKIDRGYTTQQLFNPYAQKIAGMLEMPATAIDFVNDPKYTPIIDWVAGDGDRRAMTLSETGEYIRTSELTRPLWEQTDTAKTAAQSFADFIAKKFGGLG